MARNNNDNANRSPKVRNGEHSKPKQNLTKEELALVKELYRDVKKSIPNPRSPELLYLGLLKNLPDRTGLEKDLQELRQMIFAVAEKMAIIEEKSLSRSGERNKKRVYAHFKTSAR